MLADILICCGTVLLGIAWLCMRHIARPVVPIDGFQAKIAFVRDVCDGDLNKADALIAEKMGLDKKLSYEEALNLAYLDALALMEDQRAVLSGQGRERESKSLVG